MTRFARIHKNKSANIKAPEEATSWAEFKLQMKAKKELQKEQEEDSNEFKSQMKVKKQTQQGEYSNEFPDPEQYYSGKNTYKSSWCDFEQNNTTESKKTGKKSKHQKYNEEIDQEQVENKYNLFEMDYQQEYSDENSHKLALKSKKNRSVNDEETSIDISEEVKQESKEENTYYLLKKKKRKLQETCSTEVNPKSEIKRKYKDASNDNEQNLTADNVDDISSISVKKENHRNTRENKQEYSDENSHKLALKSKKNLSVNDEETSIDISEEVKQESKEENTHYLLKKKKRKLQETFSTEVNPKSEIKRKYKDASNDNENLTADNVDDKVNFSKSVKKENHRKTRENKHGKNYGKNKKGPRGDMSLLVDGENVKLTKFDGFFILDTDAKRIKKLREKMIDEGRSKAEVEFIIRRHRRNAERALSKKKKKLCFHCREGIHHLSQCPKLDGQGGPVGSSICYKCGSTEHLLHQCKIPGNDLKFAKCFICNEVGHLSKQCPDNPRGLYPNGGSCRICGDVTHLKKDCPEIIRKRKNNTVTVGTIIGDSIESLDDGRKPRSIKSSIPCKRVNKIIKFE